MLQGLAIQQAFAFKQTSPDIDLITDTHDPDCQ